MHPIPTPLSDVDHPSLFAALNDTAQAYPRHKTIPELFEEQVQRHPGKTAVRLGSQALTYAQLNTRANQLAGVLRQSGVGAEAIVGLLAERSLEMIVGMLAILKAGGAYLPLDPAHPAERLKHMLDESAAAALLVYRCPMDKIGYRGVTLNLEDAALFQGEAASPEVACTPEGLAYVIYTSGTTGKPKGVLCTHRNVIRLVRDTNYVDISAEDRLLQISNYAFDGSVFDIFGALLNGAELVLLRREALLDVNQLAEVFRENQITLALVPTALFNMLVEFRLEALSGARQVLIGSEVASVRHVRQAVDFLGAGRVVNLYGPTEGGVCATYYRVMAVGEKAASIPIGKPLANASVCILEENGELAPFGAAGELCIGGDGLARGYLGHPGLTLEKFIPHPLVKGERLYRTGDIARWLPDGNLEFLGRLDRQVKLRGYRIELEEIENQLLRHPAVREAAVVVHERREGAKSLCAYFVSEKALTSFELRAHLTRELPDYMMPADWVPVERLPRTSNGKVNYAALPKPERTSREYEAPRSEIERQLTAVWEKVLHVSPIGTGDHFFELGGHSIQVIQLAAEFERLGIHIPVEDILGYQSIKRIADALRAAAQNGSQAPTFEEAEKLFQRQFGQAGRFVTYRVGECNYHVFHLPHDLDRPMDEIGRFFDQQVARVVLPHYFCPGLPATLERVQPLNGEQFAQLLGLAPLDVPQVAQDIETRWEQAEAEHAAAICDMHTVKSYPLGPIQYLLVMIARMPIGSIFYFDQPVDCDLLAEAFREVIGEQGVLRSTLENQGNQFLWRERQTPEKISIPSFDLSAYAPEMQQHLINRLAAPLHEKGFRENTPLYRIALVKKNFREHLVLFSADHLIYDGVAEEILRRSLYEFYQAKARGLELAHEEVLPFSDYVEQMQNSPRNVSEDEIIRLFDLEAYREYKQKVEAVAVTRRTEDCKVTTLRYSFQFGKHLDESKLWELGFSTYMLFLGQYFGFDRVPVRILSYGRHYEERNYFATLGLLVDMIPLLVPVNAQEPQRMAEHAYEKIALAAEHWVNFHKITFDMFFQQKWLRLGQLISPETLEPVNQMILFNYLGRMDTRHPEQSVLLESSIRHQERDTAVTLFYAEVRHTDETLELVLYSTIEHDQEKLRAMLDEATAKLAAKY